MGFGTSLSQLLALLLLAPLFFLPTIIAVKKNHPYKVPIILVNVLGGLVWGIGWLIALVWCFIVPRVADSAGFSAADEIQKLHDMKEKGILTQEEFEHRKSALLK